MGFWICSDCGKEVSILSNRCYCGNKREYIDDNDLTSREKRNYDIVRLRKQGSTYESIGKMYGLTRQRVEQIYSKHHKHIIITELLDESLEENIKVNHIKEFEELGFCSSKQADCVTMTKENIEIIAPLDSDNSYCVTLLDKIINHMPCTFYNLSKDQALSICKLHMKQ